MAGGFTSLGSPMPFPDLEPLVVRSLKEECIFRLEKLILSGQLQIGQRLPSERDLAASLGVSRPVLHEALVDLSAKGLVTISPRRGVFVNDFRITGSFPLFLSLINYHEGGLDKQFLRSLIEFRRVIEIEIVRQAAIHISVDQLDQLRDHVRLELESLDQPAETLTGMDFQFHQLLALASDNMLYPLLVNSSRAVYTNLTGQFFKKLAGTSTVKEVFDFHIGIVEALSNHQVEACAATMLELLQHGEVYLIGDKP
jgi:GntR family transcriptional repressor for pyruvate dehydrogenase complex